MAIPEKVSNHIINLLFKSVRKKLEKYKPETAHMPFHFKLLGRDRYAMFSFIQSINTSFGGIWEQIAVILANNAGFFAKRQYLLLGKIDHQTQNVIQNIHERLRRGEMVANKKQEIELIRQSIKKGRPKKDPDSYVDLYVKRQNEENYFDITSAKPNKKEFASLKLKLLKWTALRLSQKKSANVVTRLAIPYNPYYPKPYQRWTLEGLYDLQRGEILIDADFWNFVANNDVYNELLEIFEIAGNTLRKEIDEKFEKFAL